MVRRDLGGTLGYRLESEPGGVHPPYLRDRFKLDVEFRSQLDYAASHGIPISKYLGRVDGPEWLPEDRDAVAVWSQFKAEQHDCGLWDWQWDDSKKLDFTVCPFCRASGEGYEQVSANRKNMYGVTFGFYQQED